MKIRILETIRQGLIGGGETHLLSLVEHLDKSVFEPVVLSFTDGPMVDRLAAMGIPVTVIHTEKAFDVFKWRRVREFIREKNIDIVHAHGSRACSNVLWASKQLKLPLIYTIHGWSFHNDQHPLIRKARIRGEKYLTSRSNLNISVSESNQATGRQYFKEFESVVIPNGVDRQKYDPNRVLKDLRKGLGITREETLILFIARFTHHKQPLKVVQGFNRALKENPTLRLLMVGDGDAKQETIEEVAKLNLQDKVIFEPFRMDVPEVLAASDIFVLASLWEGLAMSLLEAMSMGRVVVASNVDGNKEVVKHLENGWLVDVGNLEEDLGKAFVSIARDTALSARLRMNALKTIDTKYTVEAMTRETEKVYRGFYKNN